MNVNGPARQGGCDEMRTTMAITLMRVLFRHMDGSGVRGRSQKQWVDYVREDLQFAELSITWWRKSEDRAGWRAAIECLLQRT